MKYKVGNKVRIKSINWYNENKDTDGFVHCGNRFFDNYMSVFCGSVVTISGIGLYGYSIQEDMHCRTWIDEMIEGLAEEISCDTNYELDRPDGYQFEDQDGNIINATKIVLTKKNEYPKTYEECCKVLGIQSDWHLTLELDNPATIDLCVNKEFDYVYKLEAFRKLQICRDAYWKIDGDWKEKAMHYVIHSTLLDEVVKITIPNCIANYLLDFPTEEMRDAFYDNFKELINECKELL